MARLKKLLRDEDGLEIVEWALLCAGFAIACIAIFPHLVAAIDGFYTRVATELAPLPR